MISVYVTATVSSSMLPGYSDQYLARKSALSKSTQQWLSRLDWWSIPGRSVPNPRRSALGHGGFPRYNVSTDKQNNRIIIRGGFSVGIFLSKDSVLYFKRTALFMFNPFPLADALLRIYSRRLLKTFWQTKKLLMTSNSSFSHNVFNSIQLYSIIIL